MPCQQLVQLFCTHRESALGEIVSTSTVHQEITLELQITKHALFRMADSLRRKVLCQNLQNMLLADQVEPAVAKVLPCWFCGSCT